MLSLTLSGTPREMGEQHAAQVAHVRDRIRVALEAFLGGVDLSDPTVRRTVEVAGRYLDSHAPRTWETYRATSRGLDFDWMQMQAYALRSYLAAVSAPEGCTVLADGRGAGHGTGPVLAKTRDYHVEHGGIQVLVHARPTNGPGYLFLGSAGSPGVFSSGINEHGLAVADTHVPSHDLGVGLPRYALMQALLERCADVDAGVAFLEDVTHMGGGTLALVDAGGDVAVCESTHRGPRIRRPPKRWAVSTNHFVASELAADWSGSAAERESTHGRAAHASAALDGLTVTTTEEATRLLAGHAGEASLCRHGGEGDHSTTILGVVFRPADRSALVAVGNPCRSSWFEARI